MATVKQKRSYDSIRGDRNPSRRPAVRRLISERNGMKRARVAAKVRGAKNGTARAVVAISPRGGERRFETAAAAARYLTRRGRGRKFFAGNVSHICAGRRERSHGWRFRYAGD